jgi:hypothetical protein
MTYLGQSFSSGAAHGFARAKALAYVLHRSLRISTVVQDLMGELLCVFQSSSLP